MPSNPLEQTSQYWYRFSKYPQQRVNTNDATPSKRVQEIRVLGSPRCKIGLNLLTVSEGGKDAVGTSTTWLGVQAFDNTAVNACYTSSTTRSINIKRHHTGWTRPLTF